MKKTLDLFSKAILLPYMRKIISLIFVVFILAVPQMHGAKIDLHGIFQGENIYVMNPFANDNVGFCISRVVVNDQVTTDEINSSAFEIDLSVYEFQIGEKIHISIEHSDNCVPKVLNPEVLKPKSTYKITAMRVDRNTEELTWSTANEKGRLPFYVEQFRWNKWIRLGSLEGKGTSGANSYSFKVLVHSGLNKYRVRQRDFTGKDNTSRPAPYRSQKQPVTYEPSKPSDKITFSSETLYEIYDMYGVRKLKGYGKEVNVKDLPQGEYFLNFDAQTEIIKKK
jgi:hypothetical protein